MHDVSFARCRISAEWPETFPRWWPQADRALKDEYAGTLNNKRRTGQPRAALFWGAQGHVGTFAAYFGDADLRIAAWRRSLLDAPGLIFYIWTPGMQPVRVHPEFKQLVTDLNLVAYWRHYGWPDHCRPLDAADFECN